MPDSILTERRILLAAVDLFAAKGYSAATTREIARNASVNETTVYRYFSTKRNLFVAAIEFEFEQIGFVDGGFADVQNATNPREALEMLVRSVVKLVVMRPKLARLLQFSVLEEEEEDPQLRLVQLRVRTLIMAGAKHLERWSIEEQAIKVTLIALFGSAIALHGYFERFTGESLPIQSTEAALANCANVLNLMSKDAQSIDVPEKVSQ